MLNNNITFTIIIKIIFPIIFVILFFIIIIVLVILLIVIKFENVFGICIVMFIILNNNNFLNCNINIIINLFEIYIKSTTFVNIFFCCQKF